MKKKQFTKNNYERVEEEVERGGVGWGGVEWSGEEKEREKTKKSGKLRGRK